MSAYSETLRQVVHIAMVGFAVLLRYFTWQQAAALALAALVFNAVALRHVAPRIIRTTDARGARAGVLFYPLSILILILVFPYRLDIVAASWAVLALGDGFATVGGQAIGGPRLPWNREKTWAGLLTFIVAGAAGAIVLSAWVAPSVAPAPPLWFVLWAPVVAAVIAGFAETLPIRLDDNLSVPFAAAGTLWFLSQLNWVGPLDQLTLDLLLGFALSLPLALVARSVGSITTGGAVVGIVFATLTYAALYLVGIAILGLALVLTIASSRIGRRRNAALGEHETRGAGNIIANCLIGTLGATLELFNFGWGLELTAVWFVAGIGAGASDTVASEIGKAFGGQPRSFPTWRRVSPGTPGAVSIAGTVAGVAGATLIAVPAAVAWLIPWSSVGPIVLACTSGAFVESALATRLESDGVLDNNTLNFINTTVAAAIAVWWCS